MHCCCFSFSANFFRHSSFFYFRCLDLPENFLLHDQVSRKYLDSGGSHVFTGIPTEDGLQELLFSLPRYSKTAVQQLPRCAEWRPVHACLLETCLKRARSAARLTNFLRPTAILCVCLCISIHGVSRLANEKTSVVAGLKNVALSNQTP